MIPLRLFLFFAVAASSVPTMFAQLTVTYTDGETNTNSYELAHPLTLMVSDGAATQSGELYGTGELVKDGAGLLALTGVNTYQGPTTISAGTLVAVPGALSTDSAVTVNSGATLRVLEDPCEPESYVEIGSLAGGGTVELDDLAFLSVGTDGTDTTFSGSIITVGELGAFEKTGGGTLTLTGASTISGILSLCGCTPDNALKIDGGSVSATFTYSSGGALSVTGGGQLATDALITFGAVEITGAGSSAEADLVIVGDAFVEGGSLHVGAGAELNAEEIEVAGTGVLNVDGTISCDSFTVVSWGGEISGNGSVGDLLIDEGGVISPGNSTGTLTAENVWWESGGAYVWEINDATGTSGGDAGWDWLNINGGLSLIGIDGEYPFLITVRSLDGDTEGDAANFDPSQSYSWIIATAQCGIIGFSPERFVIEASGFSNAPDWRRFSITSDGANLILNYSPVPEPATWGVMIALGLLGVAALRRRRLVRVS